MVPIFFEHKDQMYKWFTKNHLKTTEVFVGLYKVGTGKPSVTWSETVDVAICFGWIDGIRRTLDEHSYVIRFTPRKPTSIWSAVNIAKAEELIKQNLMQPQGMAVWLNRKEHLSKIYSYETEEKVFSEEYEKIFKANKAAWKYFNNQAPYYRKTVIHWVLSAKQETTRIIRLETLITDCEAGRIIKVMNYGKK